jgi:hypothetical protein
MVNAKINIANVTNNQRHSYPIVSYVKKDIILLINTALLILVKAQALTQFQGFALNV